MTWKRKVLHIVQLQYKPMCFPLQVSKVINQNQCNTKTDNKHKDKIKSNYFKQKK